MSETPVLILREGTSRSRGRDAQRSNIMAAKIVAEIVRSTIGPRGMDKMLVAGMGDIVITNDGATIMKEMDVQNPAAKMIVEISKTQDSEVGDGTTTAVVLAGELLAGAETLLDKDVHPNAIIDGYRNAAGKAQEILEKIAITIKPDDEVRLKQVAMTSLNTKGIFGSQNRFAELAVEAVMQVSEKNNGKVKADIDLVKVMKKNGKSLEESELVNGIIIDKEVSHSQMPKSVTGAKIALLNAMLEIEKTETDAKININKPEDMYQFIQEEEKLLREMADQVAKAERSRHDALSVVRNAVEDGKIVAGGGAPEIEVSKRLREYAIKVGGREQLAVTAFAEALESIPVAIAQNAGVNPIDILVDLKSKHNSVQNIWFGVNTKTGKASDMLKMDVVEPLRVKTQVIKSAVEAVTMILRVDDVFASKGGSASGPGPGGPGGMPPGMGGGMPPGMMGGM